MAYENSTWGKWLLERKNGYLNIEIMERKNYSEPLVTGTVVCNPYFLFTATTSILQEFAIPFPRKLWGASQFVREIDVVKAKHGGVSIYPFKVIQHRPYEVTTHIGSASAIHSISLLIQTFVSCIHKHKTVSHTSLLFSGNGEYSLGNPLETYHSISVKGRCCHSWRYQTLTPPNMMASMRNAETSVKYKTRSKYKFRKTAGLERNCRPTVFSYEDGWVRVAPLEIIHHFPHPIGYPIHVGRPHLQWIALVSLRPPNRITKTYVKSSCLYTPEVLWECRFFPLITNSNIILISFTSYDPSEKQVKCIN